MLPRIIVKNLILLDYVYLPSLIALLVLFTIVNMYNNVYKKQNKILQDCRKKLVEYPNHANTIVALFPETYRIQWRAFSNTNCTSVAKTFEFVKIESGYKALIILVISCVFALIYGIIGLLSQNRLQYVVFVFLYVSLVLHAFLLIKRVKNKQLSQARKVFAECIFALNKCVKPLKREDSTLKEIQNLQKYHPTDEIIKKASEILHSKGIDQKRSVEQQQKLNFALNNLLSAYSKRCTKDC